MCHKCQLTTVVTRAASLRTHRFVGTFLAFWKRISALDLTLGGRSGLRDASSSERFGKDVRAAPVSNGKLLAIVGRFHLRAQTEVA
jgi:hypothetical protein